MTRIKLKKHTFKLGEGQVERLAAAHPNMPVSQVLRRIIDAYLEKRERQIGVGPVQLEVEVDV